MRSTPPSRVPSAPQEEGYRKLSPARRRLLGCSQRRLARAICWASRTRSAARATVITGRVSARLLAGVEGNSSLVAGYLLLARAEQSRLEGRSDPGQWHAAAAAWERLERPFQTTYTRFRETEALLAGGAPRQQAEAVLRPAHQAAVTLGAAPL